MQNKSKAVLIERKKIRNLYYIGSISIILLLVVILNLIYIDNFNKEKNLKIAQLSEGIYNQKRIYIKDIVNRTIQEIDIEREMILSEKKASSKSSVTYLEKVEELVKKRIKNRIRKTSLVDHGYIWINKVINYDGGDNYAIRLVHPNLPKTEGSYLSTKAKDIKGNQPYLEELNGVKKEGEITFEYYFKKMSSKKISHKMSYAKLYKKYDWIVATGVYLDDVDDLIKKETKRMEETYRATIFNIIMFSIIILLLSVTIIAFFEKRISKLIVDFQRKLSIKNKKLLKANNAKNTFFNIIAHDLRGPFGGILNMVELLERKCDSKQEAHKIIDLLSKTANNFSQLLTGLLDWATIQREGFVYNFKLDNIEAVIKEVIEDIQGMSKKKNQKIIIHCEDSVEAFFDKNSIETVIRNFLTNAVKFSEEGSSIEITAKNLNQDKVKVDVKDYGNGMDKKSIEKIYFDLKHDSTPGTAGEKGTGFGLLVAKEFISANKGEIIIESEVGKGSIFSFTLNKKEV